MSNVKPIIGFSGYVVSSIGEVFNKGGRLLSPHKTRAGYVQIKLKANDSVRRTVLVHRAVYESHVGKIPDGYWVNHKDGDKLNNSVENLECGTPSYNHVHARDVLRRPYANGESMSRHKHFDPIHVRAIRDLSQAGWHQFELAEMFGCSRVSISNILSGRTWSHFDPLEDDELGAKDV